MAPPPGPPRWVKLLLDLQHSRVAAERLRVSGYDVQAAFDHPELAVLADEKLLRRASFDGRALVTENAKDFDRIVRSWVTTGEHHAGVIFTSPRRFHRGSNGYPEKLIVALTRSLATPPDAEHDWVHWLE
jgi:hypothetical protein